jgi:hypothetical protein
MTQAATSTMSAASSPQTPATLRAQVHCTELTLSAWGFSAREPCQLGVLCWPTCFTWLLRSHIPGAAGYWDYQPDTPGGAGRGAGNGRRVQRQRLPLAATVSRPTHHAAHTACVQNLRLHSVPWTPSHLSIRYITAACTGSFVTSPMQELQYFQQRSLQAAYWQRGSSLGAVCTPMH